MSSLYKHCLLCIFCRNYHLLLSFVFLVIVNCGAQSQTLTNDKAVNNSVPTLIAFGDSFVDPGNNNYIPTIVRSNYRPYGRDFPNQVPTGRFTNGQLITDFISTYLGQESFPVPYLNPKLRIEDLMHGVSFASAGTGYDPLTAHSNNVIPLSEQLDYFKAYKGRLENAIGHKEAKDLINKALFFVHAGLNDFIFISIPGRFGHENIPALTYVQFVVQQAKQFIQALQELGARRIAVSGLPPFGCFPLVITVRTKIWMGQRNCIESCNSLAQRYNRMLEAELKSIRRRWAHLGTKITYIDTFGPLSEIIRYHNEYGFEVVTRGCCGTGYIEILPSCVPTSIYVRGCCGAAYVEVVAAPACAPASPDDADESKFLFWDAVHPTERAYFLIFKSLLPRIDYLIRS